MNDILIEAEAIGEQPKRVAVAVGRFQPPTLGHYKVMDAMKAFIRDNKKLGLEATPVVVIVAGGKTSEDKSRNPLTAEERKSFMESSGRANGVKFLLANNAFAAFVAVREAGFEPVALAAGTDRQADYMRILDKSFKAKDGSDIKHHLIPGLDRDADHEGDDGPAAYDHIIADIKDGADVPVDMVSGTLARYAAKKGEMDAFAYLTGLSKKPKLAAAMAKKIQDGAKQ
jgi:hypothetical protein